MVAATRLISIVLLVLAIPLSASAQATPDDDVLYLFWGDGCPHCAAEKEFLEELATEYPDLTIEQHEVWFNSEGRAFFFETMLALGEEARSVPTTVFGGRVWIGYSEAIGTEIAATAAARFGAGESQTAASGGRTISLPVFGTVDVEDMGLLPATLAIALVDGFNPCSLWALSILLALVLRSGSRRRVIAVGGTFLIVTTVLYGLFIGGLYGALTYASSAAWIRVVMAVIALGFGLINLKDFVWFRRGPSLAIPERAKPGLYSRMRAVSDPTRPLPGVLAGTAGLAVGVSLLETPCTAGYPLLWSNLLAEHGVGLSAAAGLFAAYMLVFLVDELAIFGTAVFAMRAAKLQERAGRTLKLVSGVLMVVLAVTLIAFPNAMTGLGGALAVFGVAAAISLMALTADALIRHKAPPSPAGRTKAVPAKR